MKHIPILRFQDVSRTPKDIHTTSVQKLEYVLRYLKAKGFESISLEEIADNPDDFQPRKVALTFDGGYLGHYQFAFPLLQQYQLSAAFFIPSDMVGGLSHWGQSKKTMLSFEDVFELYQWGMDIGVNGATHTDLTTLSDNQLDDEIRQSRKSLEKMLTGEVKYFSYPFGKYNEKIKQAVQLAGYVAGVSLSETSTSAVHSRFCLDRFSLSPVQSFFTRFELSKALNGNY